MKRKHPDSIVVNNIDDLDDLKWKKVDISCGFGNIEGFIDLEEIEGVDLDIGGKKHRKDQEKVFSYIYSFSF